MHPHEQIVKVKGSESEVSQSCLTLCDPIDCSLGEGNGTPLQYSCLENPMDGGAWWAAAHGVAKSRTRLSDLTELNLCMSQFPIL